MGGLRTVRQCGGTGFWRLVGQPACSVFHQCHFVGAGRFPLPQKAKRLNKRFDKIFTICTGYQDLDDRIAKTHSKKKQLLACLKHPKVPRHNNPAELATRVQSRIRDIHLHTMTPEGTAAKDTFATITQTARKLSVNVYDYIYDRIANKFDMPSLAEVMQSKMQLAIQANTS